MNDRAHGSGHRRNDDRCAGAQCLDRHSPGEVLQRRKYERGALLEGALERLVVRCAEEADLLSYVQPRRQLEQRITLRPIADYPERAWAEVPPIDRQCSDKQVEPFLRDEAAGKGDGGE